MNRHKRGRVNHVVVIINLMIEESSAFLWSQYNAHQISLYFAPLIAHNYAVCRPPEVVISMEFAEYSVNENIRSDNFALLFCAVATDVAFQANIAVEAINGTAQG